MSVREVVEAIETDMTFRQLLEIAGALKAAQANGLQTEMVPGYPLYIDGISYWIPDVEELRFAMAAGLGVDVDSDMRQRVKKDASDYHESIPSTAGEIPADGENIGKPVRNSRNSDRDSYTRRNSEDTYNRQTQEDSSERRNYETRRNYDESQNNYDRPSQNDSRYDRSYDDSYDNSRRNSTPQIERRNIPETVDDPFEDVPTRDDTGRR